MADALPSSPTEVVSGSPRPGQESCSGPVVLPVDPVNGLNRIVLTGFMGAGKSTVGPLLAARLGWPFLDVDRQIEASHGASIADLFARFGEPWFRDLEHAAIRSLIQESPSGEHSLVLALGGGAIEDRRTLELLLTAPATRLIHLEASLETILLRCSGTEAERPVLRDRANLENRYARRLPLYRQAHHSLPVDTLTPEAAADALLIHLFPATPQP